MKKVQKLMCAAFAALTAGSLVALTACDNGKPQQKPLTDEPLTVTKIADYTKTADDRKETFASGSKGYSWENGEPFNVWWEPANVSYADGKMSLAISEMTEQQQKWDEESGEMVDTLAEYYGAETRSEHYYGFGDFSVRMKPSKVKGTASTFFTCTGPYDKWYDEDGETVIKENDHDEIDIEFLGKDTTKVQFNYFASGVGGHEYMYDLGFDASLEYHDYGFRWTEQYITWFVDSKPVYRVDRKEGENWPEDPGRVIMNYWCATETASAWMGEFEDDYSGRAEYEYAAASGKAQPDPNTAHIKDTPPADDLEVPTEGWTAIDYTGFDGWGMYTVDKTDGLTISHDEAKGSYSCCGMDLASSYSWVKFNIKNNDAVNAAELRIDVKKDNGSGGVEAISPANENVRVDKTESAAMIKLAASEELEVALKIKNIYVDKFVVFLNSLSSTAAAEGSITITGLQGIVNGEVTPPAPAEDSTVKIGENEVAFTGNYDVVTSADKSSMTIEYTDVLGKSYNNISANIADIVGNNNVFTVTIKNEGAETAKIRLDIGCAAADGSTQEDGETKNPFCNISADYDGTTVASGNDYLYGGADWMQIASGETVTVKITFTANVAKDIKFYFDSSTWDDEDTHSGKIVLSGMSLSVEGGNQPVDPPEGGDDPVNPPEGGDDIPDIPSDGWEKITDSFDGWDKYTLERFAYGYFDGIRVISKNQPINHLDNCGWALSKSYTFVKFSVKNELGAAAEMRIDFVQNGVDNSGAVKAVSVNGKSVAIDTVNTAAYISLKAYEFADVIVKLDPEKEVNLMVVYLNSLQESGNPNSGKVVFSDMKGVVNTEFSEAETPVSIPEEGWTDVAVDTFANWTGYDEFENEDGSVTIAHTSAASEFACVGMEFDKNYDWLKFSVTNNGNATVKLRIDVKKDGNDNPSLVTGAYPVNKASVIASLNAASVMVPAGETVQVVLKLNGNEYFDRLVVFLDSVKDGDNAAAGSVTIGGMQGIVNESVKHTTVDPNSDYVAKLNFDRRESDKYNVTNNDGTTTVRYDNLDKNVHYNIAADIKEFANKYNTVSITVKNDSDHSSLIRIAVSKETFGGKNDNPQICGADGDEKQVASSTGGTLEENKNGKRGTYLTIGAGETVTVTIKYDPNKGPQQLTLYIDSSYPDGGNIQNGNFTFSEITFSNK